MVTCDVIQDLLPLYADGLTSEASNALIKTHIHNCPDCRSLMEQMCTPMEPEPTEDHNACVDALRTQKKKNRRRLIGACLLTALLCVVGWWLYMETHFYGETPVVVSTEETKILKEMPPLALTQAEKELGNRILAITEIQDAMTKQDLLVIPTDVLAEEFLLLLPEDRQILEVSAGNKSVYIDYLTDSLRIILHYLDTNEDGCIDAINKTIGVLNQGELSSVREVYCAEYAVAIDRTWYEKQELQHLWFSFLDSFWDAE